MPLDTAIGSQGLEQGGANLGNDYTRPGTHIEQNETTNIGSKGKLKDDKDKKKKEADGFTSDDTEITKEEIDE